MVGAARAWFRFRQARNFSKRSGTTSVRMFGPVPSLSNRNAFFASSALRRMETLSHNRRGR